MHCTKLEKKGWSITTLFFLPGTTTLVITTDLTWLSKRLSICRLVHLVGNSAYTSRCCSRLLLRSRASSCREQENLTTELREIAAESHLLDLCRIANYRVILMYLPLTQTFYHIHSLLNHCIRSAVLVNLASFPGPAQFSVAISTEKRERAWYLFSREWRQDRKDGRKGLIVRGCTQGPEQQKQPM